MSDCRPFGAVELKECDISTNGKNGLLAPIILGKTRAVLSQTEETIFDGAVWADGS
jgi:hypothetical protein